MLATASAISDRAENNGARGYRESQSQVRSKAERE